MHLSSQPSLAIVGATGAVGKETLTLLEERQFPFSSLKLLASSRSAGSRVECCGRQYTIEELTEDSFKDVEVAFFSAGGSISKRFAPIAVADGCTVIDNSSAFRMAEDVALVIPEVNGEVLDDIEGPAIIANPNCTTMIALMAVSPLHRAVGVRRMVASSYQAASGAGAAAMAELEQQAHDYVHGRPFTQSIFGRQYLFNLFCHNTDVQSNGYNQEENKFVNETRKIWNDQSPMITITCVRVPVLRAHCIAVNLTFEKPLSEDEAREILASAQGVEILDDRAANSFPEPIKASGRDDVLVGRIRADISQPAGYGLDLFVAGDQLRKGAALNVVQIAERLMRVGVSA